MASRHRKQGLVSLSDIENTDGLSVSVISMYSNEFSVEWVVTAFIIFVIIAAFIG
jgi:hypothetical protein